MEDLSREKHLPGDDDRWQLWKQRRWFGDKDQINPVGNKIFECRFKSRWSDLFRTFLHNWWHFCPHCLSQLIANHSLVTTHNLHWGSKVSLLWQPSLIQSNSHRFSRIGYLVELNHNNQPFFFEPEIELSRFWTKFNHRLNRQILSLFLLVAQPDDFCFSFGFLNWLFRNPDPSNAMF